MGPRLQTAVGTMMTHRFLMIGLFALVPACIGAPPEDEEAVLEDADDVDDDGKFDGWSTTLSEDNLNGLWVATVDGQKLTERAVIESWSEIGIRVTVAGTTYKVVRSLTTLTGDGVTLTLNANKSGVSDDSIEGTISGKTVLLKRDTAVKPVITLKWPGDRPYRSLLTETLVPLAHQDRESYTTLRATDIGKWLTSCELYKKGSWQRTYMKGATWSEQSDSFWKIIRAVDGQKVSPHSLIHNAKFVTAVNANVSDPTKASLAMSTFTMYFATAGGRSIRMPITPDSTGYFITDRPSRSTKIGLVVMATPTHAPLASTFGRQLLDLGAMTPADDAVYTRTMMEMLAKSDVHSATELSPVAKSALTDWFSVMAIEDYRGIAFGRPGLGWGYNMSNVQFYGLVVRAAGNQVIVGNELRPGDPSYADVLNHGNDMLEYGDMARLKTLATGYLRASHPVEVRAVEDAFAGIVPAAELDIRARTDIFHFITAQLYDTAGRTANLRGPAADKAVLAVSNLLAVLRANQPAFEAYVLSQGIVKSSVPAPKSTGF
jgi:hypothetical protein